MWCWNKFSLIYHPHPPTLVAPNLKQDGPVYNNMHRHSRFLRRSMHSHYVKMQTCNWCYFRSFFAKSPNILSKSRIHYLLLFDQYFPSFLLKRHKHPLNVLNGTQWGLAFVQWQSRGLVKAEQTAGARFAAGSLKIYIALILQFSTMTSSIWAAAGEAEKYRLMFIEFCWRGSTLNWRVVRFSWTLRSLQIRIYSHSYCFYSFLWTPLLSGCVKKTTLKACKARPSTGDFRQCCHFPQVSF